MRLLILGVSALSLSACSIGGFGFGTDHGVHDVSAPAGYGQWQNGYEAGYADAGHYDAQPGYAASPCSAPMPYPAPIPMPAPRPPVQVSPCGQPIYVPPPQPCHQPQPQPCGALPMQPYQQMTTSVSYPTGYPSHPYPAPQPYPAPPVNYGCGVSTCSDSYSVSPYGADYGSDHNNHAPSPYAYGHADYSASYDQTPYGYTDHSAGYAKPRKVRAPRLRRAPHMYGTLGAVWYDMDNPYAGLQGRVGYQTAFYFGAELEGSIGVIGETSPFNAPPLSGEFKDGVDYSAGIFGTARLPLSRNISTHARVGYHTTQTYADVDFDNNPDQKTTQTLDGLAYGGGLQMDVTPVDAVRLDYTRYDDDQGGKDSVSLAYLRRF